MAHKGSYEVTGNHPTKGHITQFDIPSFQLGEEIMDLIDDGYTIETVTEEKD